MCNVAQAAVTKRHRFTGHIKSLGFCFVISEMLFCWPQWHRVVSWVTVTFLSSRTCLPFLLPLTGWSGTLSKSYRLLCVKIPEVSIYRNTQTLLVQHQQSCHSQNREQNPISAQFWWVCVCVFFPRFKLSITWLIHVAHFIFFFFIIILLTFLLAILSAKLFVLHCCHMIGWLHNCLNT